MNKGLGIAEFLTHSSRGGGGKVLSWKEAGRAAVFLHPMSPIFPVWRHNWYRVVEVEDKETGEKAKRVFQWRFVCHEAEVICRKSRFRDRDSKYQEREYPPTICPLDFMIEAVVRLVIDGKIKWTDPVFTFEGDDPEYNVTLTAAGLYGGYGRNLSKEQVADLRRAKVRRDEAWKEDARVKLNYIFQVVNADDPSDGIVTAIEPALLGDKVKAEIGKTMKRKGREGGDPTLHPYPLEWTINEDEEDFGKKYEVCALEDAPSAQVLELFRQKPESIHQHTDPGDCLMLYESMREHCCLPAGMLDFDAIFRVAREAGLMQPKATTESAVDDSDDDDAAEVDEDGVEVGGEAGDDLFDCDACGKPTMKETDLECPSCGATYDAGGLAARPCAECKTPVPMTRAEDGELAERHICPSCATIHSTTWEVVKKGGQPPQEKPSARKRSAAAKEAPTSTKPEGKPAAATSKTTKTGTVPFSR